MANLRDVRLRMRAIEQTLQVTKAMNLISTAKLRRGRRMLEDTDPFFKRIQKSMFDIVSSVSYLRSVYLNKNDPSKASRTAIIVITSDKGLAGGYNANVIRKVNELCANVQNPILLIIGNIGYRHFMHTDHVILENFSFRSQIPTLEHAEEIRDYIISQYTWGLFNEIHVVYTHMFSTIKLQPVERQVLPLLAEKIQSELSYIGDNNRVPLNFEFLPSAEAVFDTLVPSYIKGIIYGAMVEAYASEQSARMAAMDEASKSAEDMLDALRISYNRVRQANITQEMSEIVGGSTALAGR